MDGGAQSKRREAAYDAAWRFADRAARWLPARGVTIVRDAHPTALRARSGVTDGPWLDRYEEEFNARLREAADRRAIDPAAVERPNGVGMRGRDLWRDALHRRVMPDVPSPWEPLLDLWRLDAQVVEVRPPVGLAPMVVVIADLTPDADTGAVVGLLNALEWVLVPWGHPPPERHRAAPVARLTATLAPPADAKVWSNRGEDGHPGGGVGLALARFGAREAELRVEVHPRTGEVVFTLGGSPEWVLDERGAVVRRVCKAILAAGWAVQCVAPEGVTIARVPIALPRAP